MPARPHHSQRACHFPAVIVCLAAVLAACTTTVSGHGSAMSSVAGPGSTTSPPSTQRPASFTDCSNRFNLGAATWPAGRLHKLHFLCARISVPLDYADPSGRSISLQLVKVHSSANKTGNALMVNPGGPGASAVFFALDMAIEVSDRLLSHFDLVGFDPRGVNLSSPISCLSDEQKDKFNAAAPNVLTTAGFAEARQLSKDFATACTRKYGAALADFNTEQTASDMDRVRVALGGQQVNYLGFSYGTELGAAYAHLFPHNIRVAVLDGAVDPLTDDITSLANQLKAFEAAFDEFAVDCATRSPCKSLGNPRQVVYDLVKQAGKTPIKTSAPHDNRAATGTMVLTGVLWGLYSRFQWPHLGDALVAAAGGDSRGLFALADGYNERRSDGTYTNAIDANIAIECNDAKPGPSDLTIRATAKDWAKAYPMFGAWFAAGLFACQQWQPERSVEPLPSADTPQKVLVIGNLHDPATPYQGAKDLTKTLGNAELLTWDGEGHTSFLQGSSCIDKRVEDYLIDGTLPPVNTTCPR